MNKLTIPFLIAISVASQLVAAITVIQALNTARLPPAIFGWQALSALSAAAAFTRAMPLGTKRSHVLAGVHCFVMSLFVPVVGQVLFWTMALHARKAGPVSGPEPANTLGIPRFDPDLLSRVAYGGPESPAHPVVSRSEQAKAMLADQGATLLHMERSLDRWLEHNEEEIRLMAFGLRSMGENTIAQAISRTTQQLSAATNDVEKARLHTRLGQLHWQLIDLGLVQPEMERLVIAACEEHANRSLSLHSQQAQAWFILALCANRSERPEQAAAYLNQARQHHFPEAFIVPELAKAAFRRRDYRGVCQALGRLRHGAPPLSRRGILEYWKP